MNFTIDISSEESLKSGAAHILKQVRPKWDHSLIKWKIFSDGITNKLIGAWCGDVSDMVLVRIYGVGTDRIIDRKKELENMRKMQEIGCGSKVYGSFNNGLCYEFIHGDILTQDKLMNKSIYKSVARMMAKMHSVPIESQKPVLWDRIDHFINCCNPIHDRLLKEWMNKDQLKSELKSLKSLLEGTSSPIVFCHNDALLGNIVLQNEKDRAIFIDMEYGGPSYAAFDIANHFVEFVGCDGVLDYSKWLPDEHYQKEWIKEYLKNRTCGTDEDVDDVFDQVQKFMLCAHLLWSVWSVIQAENSDIEFDFVDYAIQRIREYKRWQQIIIKDLNSKY